MPGARRIQPRRCARLARALRSTPSNSPARSIRTSARMPWTEKFPIRCYAPSLWRFSSAGTGNRVGDPRATPQAPCAPDAGRYGFPSVQPSTSPPVPGAPTAPRGDPSRAQAPSIATDADISSGLSIRISVGAGARREHGRRGCCGTWIRGDAGGGFRAAIDPARSASMGPDREGLRFRESVENGDREFFWRR